MKRNKKVNPLTWNKKKITKYPQEALVHHRVFEYGFNPHQPIYTTDQNAIESIFGRNKYRLKKKTGKNENDRH